MAEYGVYVPWEQLKEYIPIRIEQARDDANLFRICIEASRKFDAHAGRKFYPTQTTRYYDDPDWTLTRPRQRTWVSRFARFAPAYRYPLAYKCDQLVLDDDLLEVISLTSNNGADTVAAVDYNLLSADNSNWTPYNVIELIQGNDAAFTYSSTPQDSNAVTGYWGYHEHWADAWQDSQDTVENNPLSSSATTITVNDVDGANLYGLSPRFMVQQLLKIESEWLFVTGKNTNTNVLTVIRGVNGTTAAAHVQNTPIYIYQPMAEIVGAMEVLATYIYRRRESVGSLGDQGTAANGVLVMPSKLPQDVMDMLNIYKRWTRS